MTSKKSVGIVIPIYKNKLYEYESISLAQCFNILSRYPIFIIKPESLDVSSIQQQYPQVSIKSFDDDYFNDGLYGYNKLMLSQTFYEKFLQYDYILIYQLDAWVFQDELEYWCSKNYDYIGAPWIIRPIFNLLPLRIFIYLQSKYYNHIGRIVKYERVGNKVGNGGFSLRKVKSFYQSVEQQQGIIEYYNEQSRKIPHFFNEDVFWSLENLNFRYPPYKEALQFSFDNHPKECMQMNNNTLPFGCHGWSKPRKIKFWKDIILRKPEFEK